MNCKHKNLIKKRVTTGKCYTDEEHGCMEFCRQPAMLQEYLCTDCGKEIYKKLNFFMWVEYHEKLPHEEYNTKWIENFCRNRAWQSYDQNDANHCGDCTNWPLTCSLCILTDALLKYREYYTGNNENNN